MSHLLNALYRDIEKAVRRKIATDENIGDHPGGSGHLGHTSFTLDHLEYQEKSGVYHVQYEYTVFIETEFTYYPDNPPHQYQRKKHVIMDANLTIISEGD